MALVVTDAGLALLLAAISFAAYAIVRHAARRTRSARRTRGYFDQIPGRFN